MINATITLIFENPKDVNRLLLQEYIKLGQRVKAFNVEAEVDGKWKQIDTQTTIGSKRILRFNTVKASKIRINITDAKASPVIANIAVYNAPKLLTEPAITRNKEGMVTFGVPDKNVEIYYTLDGSNPSTSSSVYITPFLVDKPTTIKAVSLNPEDKQQTEVVTKYFDISKKDWKVVKVSSGKKGEAGKLMDDNPGTFWATNQGASTPQEVVIDLGKQYRLDGFSYWPLQERYPFGIITHYEFSVSTDNRNWKVVATGEFGNIFNNPIEQTVKFNTREGRYIKLKGVKVKGDDMRTSFGEIGVITSN